MGLFDPVEPETCEVLGNPLRCQVCGYDKFWQRSVQLNTAGMEFLNLSWANESANCLVCDKCGYIHWFV